MSYGLKLITPSTLKPVTLDEAKEHCQVFHSDDDAYVMALIGQAVSAIEAETPLQLLTATWEIQLDRLPGGTRPQLLPKWPLQSITSITIDGVAWDSGNYTADTHSQPGRVLLAKNVTWPAVESEYGGAVLRYTAGHAAVADVPGLARTAVLELVAHYYEHREPIVVGSITGELPFAIKRLLVNLGGTGDEFVDYGNKG